MSIYAKERPEFFRRALDSIFAQTCQPSEIILIKDGPLTQELNEIITEYSRLKPIFKILVNEKNMGLGPSLAKGVIESSNEYIFRMDTDDMMSPLRFEIQLPYLINNYDVVGCLSASFDGISMELLSVTEKKETHDEIIKEAHHRTPISHPASAFRKSAVISAGNYHDNNLFEDYDLWIRMIMNGARFYNVQHPLLYFRHMPSTIERRGGWCYAINEIKNLYNFYRIGFYSLSDLIRNVSMRSTVRVMPIKIRAILLKKYQNSRDRRSKWVNFKFDWPPKYTDQTVSYTSNFANESSKIKQVTGELKTRLMARRGKKSGEGGVNNRIPTTCILFDAKHKIVA